MTNKDGKLYYSNGTENIDLNLNSDSVLINEQNLKDSSSISIDEMFEKNLLKEGDKIILLGYGGGLNTGSILLEI